MKGMVFTEMMEMVETKWSLDMVDAIIARSHVASGGAYTAVGTYPHEELLALVTALSVETGIPPADLVRTFGQHLFGRFALAYPRFFKGAQDSFQFLSGIEDVIHSEVRKLYPDAELPTFEVDASHIGNHQPGDSLALTYYSEHPFADLAQGLIEGCVTHFGEAVEVRREAVTGQPGAQARFTLTRLGACRTLGVDSEKGPQRGQFLPESPPHSRTMGQDSDEKWTAAALSQPTIPKSDRLQG
jgi:hypothetical protein